MYEAYFGLREKPFSLLPDPSFLFPSKKHRMALAMLEYGLLNQAGFSLVTGGIGTGKTTLLRALLDQMDSDMTVGLISNTHKSFGDLLQWVLHAFSIDTPYSSNAEAYRVFVNFLVDEYAKGHRVILIIDEAQNLSADTLEELRMISNVNADKDQLLQMILVGQKELRVALSRPELEQFAQRISVDYHLDPLSAEDTQRYIRHRLEVAGGSGQIFGDDACSSVYECTFGVPRLINSLCDTAMVYAFADQIKVITSSLIEDIAKEKRAGGIFPTQPETA